MTTIAASLVKELREATGAGMMDCKRALAENEGDMEEARDWLRKRGQAIANKKATRKASEGLVHCLIQNDGKLGAIVEVNCETDFVARNDQFKQLCVDLAEQIIGGGPGIENNSAEEFLASPDPADAGRTMNDVMRGHVATLAENLAIGGFARVEADPALGHLHSYIHPPGKLGVLIEFKVGKPETLRSEAFKQFCLDLALHVTNSAPEFMTRDEVPTDAVDREKEIYREQMKNEGKPENIVEKIVEGKINKNFFRQSCLMEQEFVKNPDETIKKLIERVGKELDDAIEVVRFFRMKVGE